METIFIGLIWNPLLWGEVSNNNMTIEDLGELREDRFIRPATLQDLMVNPLFGSWVDNEEQGKEVRKRVRNRVLELLESGHAATSSPSFETIHPYYPDRYADEYLVDFGESWDNFPLMRGKKALIEWATYTQHDKMTRIIKQQFDINNPGRTDNSWMLQKSLVEATFGSYKNLMDKLETAEQERINKVKLDFYCVKELLNVNF